MSKEYSKWSDISVLPLRNITDNIYRKRSYVSENLVSGRRRWKPYLKKEEEAAVYFKIQTAIKDIFKNLYSYKENIKNCIFLHNIFEILILISTIMFLKKYVNCLFYR